MKTKIYNAGAWGIPVSLALDIVGLRPLPLKYSRHALTEAISDRYGILSSRHFPTSLTCEWEIVEVESTIPGRADKFVVRKPVDDRRSLVLVIQRDGFVRTLWTNLNSDGHATLNRERFDKP